MHPLSPSSLARLIVIARQVIRRFSAGVSLPLAGAALNIFTHIITRHITSPLYVRVGEELRKHRRGFRGIARRVSRNDEHSATVFAQCS